MSAVIQDPLTPGTVLRAIADLADESITDFRFAAAYVTNSGVKLLSRELESKVGAARWATLKKTIIASFDFGYTEPDGIRALWDEGFEVRFAHTSVAESADSPKGSAWHPKLYIFCGVAICKAFIGSANLSRRAMTVNTEVGCVLTEYSGESLAAAWNQLLRTSSVVTSEVLSRYEGRRPTGRLNEVDEIPTSAETVDFNEDLLSFGAAVIQGSLAPREWSCLWVETSGMSSGGSRSQLELPRYANHYFGFDFHEYNHLQRTIGTVEVVIGNAHFERSLAWHGDNGMERINLPTSRMIQEAGEPSVGWANKVILFRRSAQGSFIVSIAEPISESAARWRLESAANNNVFRLGSNSPRLCGLL